MLSKGMSVLINKNNVADVLKKMEKEGYVWASGHKPTEWDPPFDYTYIKVLESNKLVTGQGECKDSITAVEYLRSKINLNDLKSGHIITLRNGRQYVVFKNSVFDIPVAVREHQWMNLLNYKNDLKHKNDSDFDIVEVQYPTTPYGIFANDQRAVVYKEEARKPMTIEEIEEALGYLICLVDGKNE